MNMNMTDGNRGEWEFDYTASKLAEGAKAQMAFRSGRAKWWSEKKADVMAEVKDSGVEVTESVAASISNYASTTAGFGPQVTIRQDLVKKLAECHAKIEGHQRAAAEYDGWVQVLEANPEARLKLTQSDWLYFFGKV
jgi:hypothetical protein